MTFVQNWLRKWYFIPLLILISVLAYLPHIGEFGYYRDDWYLMYAANARGGDVFQGVYSADRPARAPLMSFAYFMFGLDPLYYNLSAYLFRVLGALAFLWTLRTLWSRQRTAIIFTALMFLIFPGFLSAPNAIDYQAQQASLFFSQLSIALSVNAVLARERVRRIFLFTLSILTAWIYLGFVEYFLGFEVLRVAALALLSGRSVSFKFKDWAMQTIYRWLPSSPGPIGFILWRFLIFESERKATDLGAQLRTFFDSPLLVGISWLTTLMKDVFEITVLSWWVPLTNFWELSLRLREVLFAGILTTIAVLIVLLIMRLERNGQVSEGEEAGYLKWWTEAFWLGSISVVAGFIPVILSNRDADLYGLTRYMLASSPGAAILIVVFTSMLSSRRFRVFAFCLLVGVSVLTHHLNGILWARQSDAMQSFWWQVYWRVPQIEPGTTLMANYSQIGIEEDYFVWGPANLLYHPESAEADRLKPALGAIVTNRHTLMLVQTDSKPAAGYRRSIYVHADYGNILILTQPTSGSCVQVIDGNSPIVSEYERYEIWIAAGKSRLENILLDQQTPPPNEIIFGPEPEHNWCYFYQKASLAHQQKDWEKVMDLGMRARWQGYSAVDPVEWIPFMHAAVMLGDREEIARLAPRIKRNPFVARQACASLAGLSGVDADEKAFAQNVFCVGQE